MIWSFQAVDTLFFRDGTPFNQGESPLGPISQFPPPIETLQGAIRTQMARVAGWKEGSPWPDDLGTHDSLGHLRLTGPFLKYKEHMLFPVPTAVLRRKDGTYIRLAPSKESFSCDLGDVRLPSLPMNDGADNRGAKNVERAWLSSGGFAKFLAGGLPDSDDVFLEDRLWRRETRTGIELNPESRTVNTGMLYSGTHIRPSPALSINVQVEGFPFNEMLSPMMCRLGGESRQARTEVFPGKLPIPPLPELHEDNDRLHFTVTLLTPGFFAEETESVLRHGLPKVPGKLVTACIGKITQQGGWDLVHRRPRPLMPIVPAGSTWFYTAPSSESEHILALHGRHISLRPEYGYGQVAIGTWRDYH